MRMVRVHFVASISLLVTGGILASLGLPYAVSHFGQIGGSVKTIALPPLPIDWILQNDDRFQYFMTYGLISLAVGGVLFFVYRMERKEVFNEP